MIRYIAICLFLLSLFSCAQKQTKVILLPQDNKKTGAVIIQNQGTDLTLDKPYTSVSASDKKGGMVAEKVDPEEIKKQYADLFKAELKRPYPMIRKDMPKPCAEFILYFKSGGGDMTSESLAVLPQVVKTAQKMAPCKITIIGYTDTVGPAITNIDLSLERANEIAEELKSNGIAHRQITIRGYGEYGLIVPTPDETPEARNRRVKVLIH